jgi:hypothetical protein
MWSSIRFPRTVRVAAIAASFVASYAGLEKQAHSQTPYEWADVGVDDAADMDPSALYQFREPLAPYGTWTDDPTYGTVWTPNQAAVGNDFSPYVTGGHWALTADDQWTWVSDYSFGDAPFHYGRWVTVAGGRWGWIPGRVYAPAWVTWRTGVSDQAYVGWAPQAPTWCFRAGTAVRLPAAVRAPASYAYVPSRYAFRSGLRAYVAPPARVVTIAPRTRPYVVGYPREHYSPLVYAHGPTMRVARVPAEAIPVRRVPYATRPVITAGRVYRPSYGYGHEYGHDHYRGSYDRR